MSPLSNPFSGALTTKVHRILRLMLNRALGLVLQFGSVWLMARWAGPEAVGGYSFFLAWMLVLSAVSGMGTPLHALRAVSILSHQKKVAALRRYLWTASRGVLSLGSGMCLILWVVQPNWMGVDALLWELIGLAAISALPFMLLRLFSEVLKGLDLPDHAMFWESLFLPAIFCLWMYAGHLQGSVLDALTLAKSYIVITLCSVLAMAWTFSAMVSKRDVPGTDGKGASPPSLAASVSDAEQPPRWPLWLNHLVGMLFQNMPLLILPYVADSKGMGEFAVAYRYINVTTSLLMVVASVYGPQFAREFADRSVQGLRQALKITQQMSLLLLGPLLLAYVLLPEILMALFGQDFASGANLLRWMALGQIIYASTGLVGYMMNMIHRDRFELAILISATAVMALMIGLLGTRYGVQGIAGGYALGLSLKSLTSFFAANHYLKLIKPH